MSRKVFLRKRAPSKHTQFETQNFAVFYSGEERALKPLSVKIIKGNREFLSIFNRTTVLWIWWLKILTSHFSEVWLARREITRTKQTKIKARGKLAEITAALVPCFTVPSQKTAKFLQLWSGFSKSWRMAIYFALNLFKTSKYPIQ